jgi:arsenate reductase
MNIQIFGTKKCKDTGKAVRFFKERGIGIHQVDLAEKGMSKGELSSVARTVPLEELIDKNSKEYERMNLKYIKYDTEKVLLENPLLIKTPIVRKGNIATCGFQENIWKEWALELKK